MNDRIIELAKRIKELEDSGVTRIPVPPPIIDDEQRFPLEGPININYDDVPGGYWGNDRNDTTPAFKID